MAPTLMPAIAPVDSFLLPLNGGLSFDDVAFGSGADDGEDPSAGNGSPGFNMYELLSAKERCVARETLLLGFMTPTMPYVMQLPGALQ